MLISVCLIGFLNNSLGGGFNAIASKSADYFDTSTRGINTVFATTFIAIFIFNFPAQLLLDAKGIKFSLYVAVACNVVGGWIRFFGKDGGEGSFIPILIGSVLCSIGGPFATGLGPSLATRFFPPQERILVVGLTSLLALFGGGFGMAIGPVFKDNIGKLIILQTILQSVQVFFLISIKNAPDLPPCPLPSKKEAFTFSAAQAHFIKHPHFFRVALVAGGMPGSIFTLMGFIDQITPFTSEEFNSALILLLSVFGIVGVVINGRITDKHRNYADMFRRLFCMNLAAVSVFVVAIQTESKMLLLPPVVLMGMTGYPLMPIVIEWCVEITYKPGCEYEGTVFGVFQQSISFFVVTLVFATDPDTIGNYKLTAWILLAVILCCGSLTCVGLTRDGLKRLECEKLGYSLAGKDLTDPAEFASDEIDLKKDPSLSMDMA